MSRGIIGISLFACYLHPSAFKASLTIRHKLTGLCTSIKHPLYYVTFPSCSLKLVFFLLIKGLCLFIKINICELIGFFSYQNSSQILRALENLDSGASLKIHFLLFKQIGVGKEPGNPVSETSQSFWLQPSAASLLEPIQLSLQELTEFLSHIQW